MAQKRDHDSSFQSDIITIFVGPERKRFNAHRQFLIKCDFFFTACLKTALLEGDVVEISLPKDSSRAFSVLLGFIYHDKLPSHLTSEETLRNTKSWRPLLTAYVTAGEYCYEELQNEVVNVVAKLCRTLICYSTPISICNGPELVDSKLRMLIVQNLAYHLLTVGYDECCRKDEDLDSFVRGGSVNSVDILKATLALANLPERKNPAETENVCELYHVHNKTKKCKKAKD